MAQFDAIRMRSGELILVLQSDLIDYLPTRLVAPLLPVDSVPSIVPRLNPKLQISGETYVLATHLAATVPVRELGSVEATLEDQEYVIKGAIDMLTTGF